MTTQDQQLDAAEYVIGTLTPDERQAFERSVASDGDLGKEVSFWERMLGLVTTSIPPEVVPDHIWPGIERAIGARSEFRPNEPVAQAGTLTAAGAALREQIAANDNLVADLRKSRRRWRFGAIAAALAAIGFGAILINSGVLDPPPKQQIAGAGQSYIAVVNASGDQPSLVVNVDTATGEVTVRSLGIEKPPKGKSLELWYIPEGQGPISMGLVEAGVSGLGELSISKGGLLAVSLEPEGGSPTGTATGPILYTGNLVENVNPKSE